jgi:phosphopentomutase
VIKRVIIIVVDGLGVGALPDAGKYDDTGANTLQHILENAGQGYTLLNLFNLGLGNCLENQKFSLTSPVGSFGRMMCSSNAKDSTAGHWELMGLITEKPFPTYPDGFPKNLVEKFEKAINLKVLGNCTASGTEIIERLGAKHLETGSPILYTSADSVFQLAAHEEKFGLNRLYEICETAREMLTGEHSVARVIARPFIGTQGKFIRTPNRRDYSLFPFAPTLLDKISESSEVIGIGKIGDLFNHRGITKEIHTNSNIEGMNFTLDEIKKKQSKDKSLIFTNLVDFDTKWGHRRDISSFAQGLKDFDSFLPEITDSLSDSDCLIITADHGCDPSYTRHTDHTREYIPVVIYGNQIKKGVNLGVRKTFADLASTVADLLKIPFSCQGKSFYGEII